MRKHVDDHIEKSMKSKFSTPVTSAGIITLSHADILDCNGLINICQRRYLDFFISY